MKSEKGWPIERCGTCRGGSEEFRKHCSNCKGTSDNSKNPISYNGTNESGFNALPVEVALYSQSILIKDGIGSSLKDRPQVQFWNCSIDIQKETWLRAITEDNDIYKFSFQVNQLDINQPSCIFLIGASVRCVKD